MKKNALVEMIENLKVCIDVGHHFKFVERCPFSGRPSRLTWRCKRCKFMKDTKATEEQEKILMEHKTLKP